MVRDIWMGRENVSTELNPRAFKKQIPAFAGIGNAPS
jgi:hypothetical protein